MGGFKVSATYQSLDMKLFGGVPIRVEQVAIKLEVWLCFVPWQRPSIILLVLSWPRPTVCKTRNHDARAKPSVMQRHSWATSLPCHASLFRSRRSIRRCVHEYVIGGGHSVVVRFGEGAGEFTRRIALLAPLWNRERKMASLSVGRQ